MLQEIKTKAQKKYDSNVSKILISFEGMKDNSDIKKCLENGSMLASKIIQKIGARLD